MLILAFASEINRGLAFGNVGSEHDMATHCRRNLIYPQFAACFQLPIALCHGSPQNVVWQLRDRPSISIYSACACTMSPWEIPCKMENSALLDPSVIGSK